MSNYHDSIIKQKYVENDVMCDAKWSSGATNCA